MSHICDLVLDSVKISKYKYICKQVTFFCLFSDSIDYKEFKKELECVLKENENESKADSTTENSN